MKWFRKCPQCGNTGIIKTPPSAAVDAGITNWPSASSVGDFYPCPDLRHKNRDDNKVHYA